MKDEIEKERRKSQADEGMIRKLEGILGEKERIIDENNKKKSRTDNEIHELKDLIEAERRKSMADEQKLVELTRMLDAKVKLSNDQYDRIADMTRKSERDEEEITFLRQEIDKERRKSNADEATIKKLEYLMAEKLKMVDESKAR